MSDRPAWLLGDTGNVILTPAGARLVLAAMWRARQYKQATDGGAAVSEDFRRLYEVCRIAAGSFPPATAGRMVRVVMPSSESRITVAVAAQILGHSVQAVRKQAALGRYGAARHGRVWTLSEREVRQVARRRRNGQDWTEDLIAAAEAAIARSRTARAAGGRHDAGQVKQILTNQRFIAAALSRGALTPKSALKWAKRAARGEDISSVGDLTGMPWLADENKRVQAQSNSSLMNQIVDLLSQAIDADAGSEPDPEFGHLFPPYDMPRRTLVYDQNDDGTRPAPQTVPGAGMLPGFKYGGTDNTHMPYARAGRFYAAGLRDERTGRYDDDRITDADADSLFPLAGQTAAQSAQAAAIDEQERREAAVRAGALAPYSDSELDRLLFGETT